MTSMVALIVSCVNRGSSAPISSNRRLNKVKSRLCISKAEQTAYACTNTPRGVLQEELAHDLYTFESVGVAYRPFALVKAGALEETIGLKANVGLMEKPPCPRVMENEVCIAPASSDPLYVNLSPNCFASSISPKSGQPWR